MDIQGIIGRGDAKPGATPSSVHDLDDRIARKMSLASASTQDAPWSPTAASQKLTRLELGNDSKRSSSSTIAYGVASMPGVSRPGAVPVSPLVLENRFNRKLSIKGIDSRSPRKKTSFSHQDIPTRHRFYDDSEIDERIAQTTVQRYYKDDPKQGFASSSEDGPIKPGAFPSSMLDDRIARKASGTSFPHRPTQVTSRSATDLGSRLSSEPGIVYERNSSLKKRSDSLVPGVTRPSVVAETSAESFDDRIREKMNGQRSQSFVPGGARPGAYSERRISSHQEPGGTADRVVAKISGSARPGATSVTRAHDPRVAAKISSPIPNPRARIGAVSLTHLERRIIQKTGVTSQSANPSLEQKIAEKTSGERSKGASTSVRKITTNTHESDSSPVRNLEYRIAKKLGLEMTHEQKIKAKVLGDSPKKSTQNKFPGAVHQLDDRISRKIGKCDLDQGSDLKEKLDYEDPEQVPSSANQDIDSENEGISICGATVSKRFICFGVIFVILIAIVGSIVPVVMNISPTSSDSNNDVERVDGSFLTFCSSDDDCLTSSPVCHRGRCRSSGSNEITCDRLDVCKSADCPQNAVPCFDANYGSDCDSDDDCDGNICALGKCASGIANTACEDDMDCLTGLCSEDNMICTEKKTTGSVCTRDEQCHSSSCVDGECAAGEEGKYCELDEDCSSLICGQFSNRCRPQKEVGKSCQVDENCKDGFCAKSTCSVGNTGDICDFNSQCKLGYCFYGSCIPVPAGNRCEFDLDCQTSRCDAETKTCLDYVERGGECKNDKSCQTGNYCDIPGGDTIGTCVAQHAVGQKCDVDVACITYSCDPVAAVCLDFKKENDHCEHRDLPHSNFRCGPELFCKATNLCSPAIPFADRCERNDLCEEPYKCIDGLCGEMLDIGSNCTSDGACKSSNCDASGPTDDFTCKGDPFGSYR